VIKTHSKCERKAGMRLLLKIVLQFLASQGLLLQ
jgi:hypothetical protein